MASGREETLSSPRGGLTSPRGPETPRALPGGAPTVKDAWRAGWLRKKPTSETGKPWKNSKVCAQTTAACASPIDDSRLLPNHPQIDKRFYVTKGFRVDYYDKALQPGQESKIKPKGTFDLRDVAMLRPPEDATAPQWALEVIVDDHGFVLDFGYRGERDMWLRIWCNAIESAAVLPELLAEFSDNEMKAECERLGPKRGAVAKKSSFANMFTSVPKPSLKEPAKPAAAPTPTPAADAPKPAAAAEPEAVPPPDAVTRNSARSVSGAAAAAAAAVAVEAATAKVNESPAAAATEADATGPATLTETELVSAAAREGEAAAAAAEAASDSASLVMDDANGLAKLQHMAATKIQDAMRSNATKHVAATRQRKQSVDDQREVVRASMANAKEAEDAAAEAAAEEEAAAAALKAVEAEAAKAAQEEAAQTAADEMARKTIAEGLARAEEDTKKELAKAEAEAAKAEAEAVAAEAAEAAAAEAAKAKAAAKPEPTPEPEPATKPRSSSFFARAEAEEKAAAAAAAETAAKEKAEFEAEVAAAEAKQIEKEENASKKVQALMRGKAARKTAAAKKEAAQKERKEREAEAATKLQALERGKKTREAAAVELAAKKEAAQKAALVAAARKKRADGLAEALALVATIEQLRLQTMDPQLTPPAHSVVHALCRCLGGAGFAAFGPSAEALEASELNQQGLTAHSLGKSQVALRRFSEAAQKQPWRSRYVLSAANMYLKLDMPEAARALYEWLLSVSLIDAEHAVAEAKLAEMQKQQ